MATPPADHRRSLRHPPPPPDLAIAPSSAIPASSGGRSLSMLLPVLMLFFLLLCFLSIFLLRDALHFACLSIRRRRRRRRSRDPSAPAGVGSEGAKAGLDPAILASFPTLPYAAVRGVQEGKCGAECAVCLAEFRGSDAVRLLTVCCHAFHPACIDLWLETHTTCPLCRSDLQAPPDEAAVIAVHEAAAVDSGNLNSSGSHTIAIDEAEERSRKSRSSSLSIAIERGGEEGGV